MALHSADADLERERQAILRAQAGELRALEPVLQAHAEPLFATLLLPRMGLRAEAEDLLRETLVTAIERIGTFRWQGRSVYFWLRQIALRKLVDWHRRRGRKGALDEALLREADAAEQPPAADAALIAEEDRRRERARIEAALVRLPDRYATAVRLRLCDERPREECAAALGVSVATFDVVLFRAVRAFRKAYGERDE